MCFFFCRGGGKMDKKKIKPRGDPVGFRRNRHGGVFPIYELREALKEEYESDNTGAYKMQHCNNCIERWKPSKDKSGKAENIEVKDGKVNILGETLEIDGKRNKFAYDQEEKAIMDSLARNYDVKVQMLPKINNPKGT